jgi:hypothetical protein
MPIWSILWPFGVFDDHLEYFMTIWYILCGHWYIFPFGVLYQSSDIFSLIVSKIMSLIFFIKITSKWFLQRLRLSDNSASFLWISKKKKIPSEYKKITILWM